MRRLDLCVISGVDLYEPTYGPYFYYLIIYCGATTCSDTPYHNVMMEMVLLLGRALDGKT